MNIITHAIILCMSGVLYIDKPKGISSFDICYKLRKVLGTKRIGHTGTLDPNATGVMIVLYNDATKGAQFLVSDTKVYETRVLFGIETDTLDIDGNIINKDTHTVPSKEDLISVLNSFKGQSKQIVPLTSAKKINGKKLYEYQLEGKQVELPEIDINIYDIELLDIYDDGFSFKTKVSSGTYIRSLVRDILAKLNIIGTVSELRRTCIDDIEVNECDNLQDVLVGKYNEHSLLDVLSKRYKVVDVDNIDDIKNGKRIKLDIDDKYVVITNKGFLLAMYTKDGNEYRSARGLW